MPAPAAHSVSPAACPERIVAGAFACLAEKEASQVTIADLRRASGASTGSIYHHFGDKQGVFATLYVELLRGYQASLLRTLRRARSGEAVVKGIVRHYLAWVEANPAAARFLLEMRDDEAVAQVDATIRSDTRALYDTVWEKLRACAAVGEIRRVPRHLLGPLTVGVAQAAARSWLQAGRPAGLDRDARTLAEVVWRGLAAKPPKRRGGRT